MSTFIITRIHVGDYERWRPMFDQDQPRAREKATEQRVFRGVDDPNQVAVSEEGTSGRDDPGGKREATHDLDAIADAPTDRNLGLGHGRVLADAHHVVEAVAHDDGAARQGRHG